MKAIRLLPLGMILAGACGGNEPAVEAPGAVAETPDTALLSAAAVRIGGFEVAQATLQAWADSWRGPARLVLDPAGTQVLGAIAEGRITRVEVMPGDHVRAGQVLVALHSHEMMDARAALAQAQADETGTAADLSAAESAAGRAERLYAAKAASLADLERSRAALADARAMHAGAAAELKRARAMVAHLVGAGPTVAHADEHEVLIRSPIDGVVVSRRAQPGEVALVGAPLVTVSRLSRLALLVNVPEAELAAARPGAEVRFKVTAYPDRMFSARVVRVAPAVDTLTRTVEVQASVDDTEGALRAEMFADAEILGLPGDTVVVVPSAAVQLMDERPVVITAAQRGEGMLLEAVPVRVGRRTRDLTEVVAGLEPGQSLVVGGAAVAKAEIIRRREREGAQ
jgi:cobalt-zinc-cadmium efflux system membrane fusion protein